MDTEKIMNHGATMTLLYFITSASTSTVLDYFSNSNIMVLLQHFNQQSNNQRLAKWEERTRGFIEKLLIDKLK
jgi:general stress protein 26